MDFATRSTPDSPSDGSAASALRLFVAIELPEEWRGWLARVASATRRTLADEFRWVDPRLMHITVCFLGSQREDLLPTIAEALRVAASRCSPFSLEPGCLGGFSGRPARVLWVGADDPSGSLPRLRRDLDRELESRGIVFDRKPLVAHVTIARSRTRGARAPLDRLVAVAHSPRPGSFRVEHVALVRSHLARSGPRYDVIERFPLRSA